MICGVFLVVQIAVTNDISIVILLMVLALKLPLNEIQKMQVKNYVHVIIN